MNTVSRSFIAVAVMALFLISSCASTKLSAVWKDESYAGTVKKVLIIGISKNETTKKFFEREFSKQLKKRGIEAIPAYDVLPATGELDKETVESKVKELGIETVLITRYLDQKTMTTHIPGQLYVVPDYYRGYMGFYNAGYRHIYEPGYQIDHEIISLETNVYDVKSGKLVWSALSETFVEGAPYHLVKEFIEIMLGRMEKDGIITKS